MGDYTRSARAARLTEKRKAEGWQRFNVWTPPATPVDRMKRLFPGKQGGIDWEAVISAALAHADHKPEGGQ